MTFTSILKKNPSNPVDGVLRLSFNNSILEEAQRRASRYAIRDNG